MTYEQQFERTCHMDLGLTDINGHEYIMRVTFKVTREPREATYAPNGETYVTVLNYELYPEQVRHLEEHWRDEAIEQTFGNPAVGVDE